MAEQAADDLPAAAIDDMADAFEAVYGVPGAAPPREESARSQPDIFKRVQEVADSHGIADPDARIELACTGYRRWFERLMVKSESDLREKLEAMRAALGGEL